MSRIGSRTGLFALSGSQGVTSIEDMMRSTGRRFFVHATRGVGGTTAGFGDNPDRPFTTFDSAINVIAAAVTEGTLDASDSKHVVGMPGHAETLADATSLVMDQNNISLIGDGRGAARPTLTMSATGSNVPISGAGCSMSNILMTVTGTVDVTSGITVTGVDCKLEDIEIREVDADTQFIDGITCSTCARLEVIRYKFMGQFATDEINESALTLTDTSAECKFIDLWLVGRFNAAGLDITGAATELVVDRPFIEQRHSSQDACIVISGTATGFIVDPCLRTATNDDAGITAAITTTNNMQLYNVKVVNNDGETAYDTALADLDVTNVRSWGVPSSVA